MHSPSTQIRFVEEQSSSISNAPSLQMLELSKSLQESSPSSHVESPEHADSKKKIVTTISFENILFMLVCGIVFSYISVNHNLIDKSMLKSVSINNKST